MNVRKIRADFPIFGSKDAPKECVPLDNAATSHKPHVVIDAIVDFYKNRNANIHRGLHDLSENATTSYEEVRGKVARFINAADPSEIIFTSGTTGSINFVADAWAARNLQPGDEILITQAEHHSNFLPWQRLAAERGLTLKILPLHPEHFIIGCMDETHYDDAPELYGAAPLQQTRCNNSSCDYLANYLTSRTKLVAVSTSSNVIGPLWDRESNQLKKLIARAHDVGAKVLLDAAQSVGHQKVDVQKWDADFVAFSGHKMLAPTGVGVLYMPRRMHDVVAPYQVGGGMVHRVSTAESQWDRAPKKFEAGTPAIASVIGLGAAIDYLNGIDMQELQAHEAQLCAQLIDGLAQFEQVEILGNIERLKNRGHVVSFTVDGVHPHDIASHLDMRGIAVRAGHHCAQPLATHLGITSSLRVSFHLYNSADDIAMFLQELGNCLDTLGGDSDAGL